MLMSPLRAADNGDMTNPNFRDPLPEDLLSERERDERICILDQFSKKLKEERKAAGFDDRIAIRQLLVYVGKRLDLLDIENRHARGLAQYDSLLGRTTKPVPQDLIGVAADAILDYGLKDREKMIRRHERNTEPLIAEISLLAPEIDKLLEQRQADDRDKFVLRPSSCLSEAASMNQDAPSKFEITPEHPYSDGAQTATARKTNKVGEHIAEEDELDDTMPTAVGWNKKQPNRPNTKAPKTIPPTQSSDIKPNREWLEQRKSIIKVNKKPYGRNSMADALMKREYFSEPQLNVAVLWLGYAMGDTPIANLLGYALAIT